MRSIIYLSDKFNLLSLFKFMRKLLLVSFVLMVAMCSNAWAQATKNVTGKVTSALDGSPLPGVNVVVKGTTGGITTDVDGKYSISVPETGAVLFFSFVGMNNTEVEVGDKISVDIAMETDIAMLGEVIVTAVGLEKTTRSLAYSVQKVGGQELVDAREANVVNAMAGKVAGVQITTSSGSPGSSASIRIRGNNSITGSVQPLFIVDGIPINNDENASAQERDANVPFTQGVGNSNRGIDINPDDIETMTVLKGPAATALYGIRAGNGAVVITTKRGGRGKKPSITYSTSVQLDQVNKLPELQTKFVQGSAGNYRGPETGGSGSWGAMADTLRWNGDASYKFDKNGKIVGRSAAPNGKQFTPYDNADQFFRTGITTNQNISVSGGGDNSSYYASVSHLAQKGVVPLSDFKRTSIKFTNEAFITNDLKVTSSFNYVNSGGRRVQQGSNISGLMLGLLRTPISFDNSNGSDSPSDASAYFFGDEGRQRSYRYGGAVNYDNPYFTINRNPYKDNVNRIIAYTQVDYHFTDWLSLLYRVGMDYYSENRKGAFDITSSALPSGRVYQNKITNRDFNSDFILKANKSFGDININALVGHNYYGSSNDNLYTQGDGMVTPTFYSIANTSKFLVYQGITRRRRAAIYSEVTASYKDKLYLTMTGRNEFSSTLPSDNNSFFFPSVSLGYVFTEDLGLSENEYFNFGKIRASYAKVGRDATPYSLKTVYGAPLYSDGYTSGVSFPFNGTPGYSIGTTGGSSQPVLGNNLLKPEFNTTVEFGAELEFFKGRLKTDVTYYTANNTDQLIQAPIPSSSGFQYLTTNAGKITNNGLEVVLTVVPVKTEDFSWTSSFNYTRNRNEVVSLAKGVDNVFLNGFTGSASSAIPGQPLGVLYGGAWLRDSQGRKVIGADGYPMIDPVQRVLGNPNPDFMLGWRNTFNYKSLSFSVLMDMRKGGDIWNGTRGALIAMGRAKETENRGQKIVFDGVTESGATNTKEVTLSQSWYQGNGGGFGNQSEDFIEDGSFIRCREITVGYNFPKNLVSKAKLSSVSINFYTRNVFLITDYTGIDPETNLTGTSNGAGIDYFNMPNTRSFGASLKVGI
jgi:TonB-linked SusC/RagA family outer membrane protein